MYKNNSIFYPKDIFLNINFESIKNELKLENKNFEDYGNIIIFKLDQYFYSINSFGKLQLFYNSLCQPNVNDLINTVENKFKKQVSNFIIQRN